MRHNYVPNGAIALIFSSSLVFIAGCTTQTDKHDVSRDFNDRSDQPVIVDELASDQDRVARLRLVADPSVANSPTEPAAPTEPTEPTEPARERHEADAKIPSIAAKLQAEKRPRSEQVARADVKHHGATAAHSKQLNHASYPAHDSVSVYPTMPPPVDREGYEPLIETGFRDPRVTPLSTFSVDVDTASYSNVRRMLRDGHLPPADAVRLEEMINYFDYSRLARNGSHPIATQIEVAPAPWQTNHQLAMVRLEANAVDDEVKPSRIVFLIDTSGSMRSADKLPLLQRAFTQLVRQLGSEDRIAIVSYAGNAGLVLPSTSGQDGWRIEQALQNLHAGGSTAGSAGIDLAYRIAREHFDPRANNRVVLATDGDFNVGPSSNGELVRLIEKQRERGVYLTVLGFGRGNLKDDRMHRLADHGDGQYHYIDSDAEARRVLVEKLHSTLQTVARDVKVQVEFNPAHVAKYRLLGYETRRMAAEDFRDDRKDGGEMGIGHSMIALYEIVPTHSRYESHSYPPGSVPELRFQSPASRRVPTGNGDWLSLRVRYEATHGGHSGAAREFVTSAAQHFAHHSADWQWAATVAEFALSLRHSDYRGSANLHRVLNTAQRLADAHSDTSRREFVGLVQRATQLVPRHALGDNG